MTETSPTDKPPTFTEALHTAEQLARAAMPDRAERITDAVQLVKDGRVFQTGSGLWEVQSRTTPGRTYEVNGVCNCDDAHFRHDVCAHQMAVLVSRKIVKLMHPKAPAQTLPAEPVVPPAPCPEALFSATLRGTVDGHEVLLTARGQTADAFRRNLQAIRGLLDAPAQPVPPPPAQPLTPQQHNAATMHRPTVGVCAIHNAQMDEHQGKDGRTWRSHWCDDEQRWCKGR
jgi:hypothetical protein